MIDINKIRKDFPQLVTLLGEDNHYLDSAATSLTPQPVLDAVIDYYTHNRANVHRGLFKEAVTATELYEDARKKIAAFINASPEEIIFTSGATESSNMLVGMIEGSDLILTPNKPHAEVKKRSEIVTTVMEHHGALIPLQQFAIRHDVALHSIPLKDTELDYEKAKEFIGENTAIVSAMLASNVTGTVNDVKSLAKLAHENDAIMIVDATAALGHIPVDVKALECDALYFSGHKMLAPTGVGVLWVRMELLKKLPPSVFGGHMIDHMEEGIAKWAEIPTRFEAGTKNIASVIGLGAAVDYLNMIGVENIKAYVGELTAYAFSKLEAIEGVRIISERDVFKNVGIISFSCDWAHPHDVAQIVARELVGVRAGHHCAIPYHGVLSIESSVRASLHVYNTKEDIDALVEGVLKSKEIFKL